MCDATNFQTKHFPKWNKTRLKNRYIVLWKIAYNEWVPSEELQQNNLILAIIKPI